MGIRGRKRLPAAMFVFVFMLMLSAAFFLTGPGGTGAKAEPTSDEEVSNGEPASPLFTESLSSSINELEGKPGSYPDQTAMQAAQAPAVDPNVNQITSAADTCIGLDCPKATTGQPGERCHPTYQVTCTGGYTCDAYGCPNDNTYTGSDSSSDSDSTGTAVLIVVLIALLIAGALVFFVMKNRKKAGPAYMAPGAQAGPPPAPGSPPMPPGTFCTKCGGAFDSDDKFCKSCGKPTGK